MDPLIKSHIASEVVQGLTVAVKYPRMGVFNLNGLRADCKMDCLASASLVKLPPRDRDPRTRGVLPGYGDGPSRGKGLHDRILQRVKDLLLFVSRRFAGMPGLTVPSRRLLATLTCMIRTACRPLSGRAG